MLMIPQSVRILLWTEPVDLRLGIDGLSYLVTSQGEDVFSGNLYVFVSRSRNRVKILTWSSGGYVMWYKRLECGRFKLPHLCNATGRVQVDALSLSLLVDGIDYQRVKRPRHWTPPPAPTGHDSPRAPM
jgi:transposase